MAHVHGSVNEMSRIYLTNDRRYNYTTPKTFLGFISLYSSLLTAKHKDLQGKIERLMNGLEKLRTTSAQVSSNIIWESILCYYDIMEDDLENDECINFPVM